MTLMGISNRILGANPMHCLSKWKRALPYAAILLAVILVHCYYLFSTEGIRRFADSGGYYGDSRLSLTSVEFWSAGRSPGILLFYKYFSSFPAHEQATSLPGASGLIILDDPLLIYTQTLFSIAAWSLLAVACAQNGKSKVSRLLLFSCPLGFSVIAPVALWNFVALSESFSLSCLAVLVSMWILFLRTRRIIWVAGIALATAAFSSTRDVHVYLIPMIAMLSMGLIFSFRSQRTLVLAVLSLAVFSGVVFVTMTISIDKGWDGRGRWSAPFYDVVGKRILPKPEIFIYFEENGMPTSEALLERTGKSGAADGEVSIRQNPRLQDFRDWSGAHGRSTYMKFLITHPTYSIAAPLLQFWHMYGLRVNGYAHPEFGPLFPTGRLVRAAERRHLLTAGVFAVGIGVISTIVLWKRRVIPRAAWMAVPLAMILLSIPHAWLNWHGGGIELERHTVIAAIQAYVGSALLGLYLFDELSVRRAKTRPPRRSSVTVCTNENA